MTTSQIPYEIVCYHCSEVNNYTIKDLQKLPKRPKKECKKCKKTIYLKFEFDNGQVMVKPIKLYKSLVISQPEEINNSIVLSKKESSQIIESHIITLLKTYPSLPLYFFLKMRDHILENYGLHPRDMDLYEKLKYKDDMKKGKREKVQYNFSIFEIFMDLYEEINSGKRDIDLIPFMNNITKNYGDYYCLQNYDCLFIKEELYKPQPFITPFRPKTPREIKLVTEYYNNLMGKQRYDDRVWTKEDIEERILHETNEESYYKQSKEEEEEYKEELQEKLKNGELSEEEYYENFNENGDIMWIDSEDTESLINGIIEKVSIKVKEILENYKKKSIENYYIIRIKILWVLITKIEKHSLFYYRDKELIIDDLQEISLEYNKNHDMCLSLRDCIKKYNHRYMSCKTAWNKDEYGNNTTWYYIRDENGKKIREIPKYDTFLERIIFL